MYPGRLHFGNIICMDIPYRDVGLTDAISQLQSTTPVDLGFPAMHIDSMVSRSV